MREIGPCVSQSHIYPTGRASPVSQEAATNRTRVLLDVEVTNFGPIAKGRFKIKPLTVFVGPNNSGKTYAAMLAHSILSSYRDSVNPMTLGAWIKTQATDPELQATLATIGQIAEKSGKEDIVIPTKCARDVQRMALEHFRQTLHDSIQNVFGSNLGELVRTGCKAAKIKIMCRGGVELRISMDGSTTISATRKDARLVIGNHAGEIPMNWIWRGAPRNIAGGEEGMNDHRGRMLAGLLEGQDLGLRVLGMSVMRVMQDVTGEIADSHYVPAVRSGILAAHKTVTLGIMNGASHTGRAQSQVEQLTGVSYDFITALINMTERGHDQVQKNGKPMIGDMFGGQVVVKEPKVGLPSMMYRDKNVDIPMHRASSGIAEMATFPTFFQDYSQQGDTLIIEEPEAHLHPANQIKVANHIVRHIRKREANVLLSTHSPFILEQLSLLVKMSQLTDEQRKKHCDGATDHIDDANVAPYMFKKCPSGGHEIVKVKHSPDTGISQDEFIKVTEMAYNRDVQVERTLEKE